MQDRSFIQTGQFCHILNFIKLGRVHLLNIIYGHMHPFPRFRNLNFHFVPMLPFDAGRHKPLGIVGHPHQSLLSPFCLCRRVVEAIAVHGQVPQLRVVSIHVHHCAAQAPRLVSPGAGTLIRINNHPTPLTHMGFTRARTAPINRLLIYIVARRTPPAGAADNHEMTTDCGDWTDRIPRSPGGVYGGADRSTPELCYVSDTHKLNYLLTNYIL